MFHSFLLFIFFTLASDPPNHLFRQHSNCSTSTSAPTTPAELWPLWTAQRHGSRSLIATPQCITNESFSNFSVPGLRQTQLGCLFNNRIPWVSVRRSVEPPLTAITTPERRPHRHHPPPLHPRQQPQLPPPHTHTHTHPLHPGQLMQPAGPAAEQRRTFLQSGGNAPGSRGPGNAVITVRAIQPAPPAGTQMSALPGGGRPAEYVIRLHRLGVPLGAANNRLVPGGVSPA